MGIWKKLFKQETEVVDYYDEGVSLLDAGKYHEALVSFRLALRDAPSDAAVLQQMAITYTRIGMMDEAARMYRKALAADEQASGAHYGLAFLLLREGRRDMAAEHLRSFLASPPDGVNASQHIEHARQTLANIESGEDPEPDVDPAAGAIP